MSWETAKEAPETFTLNKLLCHRDTTIGTRLWYRGAYYKVTGIGGKGVGEHWVLSKDTDQAHPEKAGQ